MRIEALLIIALIVTGISLGIASIFKQEEISVDSCQSDDECVPAQCCHSFSCVNDKYKPNCEEVFCTQVCEGPIDCGTGYCGCVNNRCKVVPLK